MLPQWRPARLASATSELAHPAARNEEFGFRKFPAELTRRIERFRIHGDHVCAAELLESAIGLGHPSTATEAARSIILQKDRIVPLVRRQAARLLRQTGEEPNASEDLNETELKTSNKWRTRINLNQGDAIAWVELARAQLCRGHLAHAAKSMTIALQLAPNNRYVLRSAATLYHQSRDPQKAYDLIRKNPATPKDPWLMAAEIGLASFVDRSPFFMKSGLALIDEERLVPSQITELACAIGDQMLQSGPNRRGRKLIRVGLYAPTPNSVAQAEWISQSIKARLVDPAQLGRMPCAWEAKCTHAFCVGKFSWAIELGEKWIEDEAYNVMAYAGAASAANVIERFSEALDLAKRGLLHDRNCSHLLNSVAFASACRGELDAADNALKTIPSDGSDMHFIAEANRGLIAFRRGSLDVGVQFYSNAILGFDKINNHELKASALAYLAYELARAHMIDRAKNFLQASADINRTVNSPAVSLIAGRATHLLKALEAMA